jgi:hypothetical protein
MASMALAPSCEHESESDSKRAKVEEREPNFSSRANIEKIFFI